MQVNSNNTYVHTLERMQNMTVALKDQVYERKHLQSKCFKMHQKDHATISISHWARFYCNNCCKFYVFRFYMLLKPERIH